MVFATEKEAYDLLEKLGISYERLDHRPITSVQDLEFTLPGQQVKNLVLKNKKSRQFYMVILHDEKQANIADLAGQLGKNVFLLPVMSNWRSCCMFQLGR